MAGARGGLGLWLTLIGLRSGSSPVRSHHGPVRPRSCLAAVRSGSTPVRFESGPGRVRCPRTADGPVCGDGKGKARLAKAGLGAIVVADDRVGDAWSGPGEPARHDLNVMTFA